VRILVEGERAPGPSGNRGWRGPVATTSYPCSSVTRHRKARCRPWMPRISIPRMGAHKSSPTPSPPPRTGPPLPPRCGFCARQGAQMWRSQPANPALLAQDSEGGHDTRRRAGHNVDLDAGAARSARARHGNRGEWRRGGEGSTSDGVGRGEWRRGGEGSTGDGAGRGRRVGRVAEGIRLSSI
jgi:hypothetical protein